MQNILKKILKIEIDGVDKTLKAYKILENNLEFNGDIKVSYHKPVKEIHFDLQTNYSIPQDFAIETPTGDEILFLDETDGFTKSGFIYLDTEFEGNEFIIKLPDYSDPITIRQIAKQFCCEEDLLVFLPSLRKYYPVDQNSMISYIESATSDIIHKLNNEGKKKYEGTKCVNINRYDILDLEQLRNPVIKLVLSKLYRDLSDRDGGDYYLQESDRYKEESGIGYQFFINSYLTIDKDDNGKNDDSDTSINQVKFTR